MASNFLSWNLYSLFTNCSVDKWEKLLKLDKYCLVSAEKKAKFNFHFDKGFLPTNLATTVISPAYLATIKICPE